MFQAIVEMLHGADKEARMTKVIEGQKPQISQRRNDAETFMTNDDCGT
jgi:hypothetical protein